MRDQKRWEDGISRLMEAIGLAKNEFKSTKTPSWRTNIAAELADCWGILGGIERRWALNSASNAHACRLGNIIRIASQYVKLLSSRRFRESTRSKGIDIRSEHLERSIEAYDKGSEYEVLSGETSTYNRLNRLLVRLLRDPTLMMSDKIPAGCTKNMREELREVAALINPKEDDIWAAADMALLNILLDGKDAESAYNRFNKNTPDFAIRSALDMLKPLAKLDLPNANALREAERLLNALQHT